MPITLTSSDDKSFSVDRLVIKHAGTIETLISTMGLEDSEEPSMPIPLPNVTSSVLQLVIEWLIQHKDDPVKEEKEDDGERRTDDIPQWDQDFLKDKPQSVLFDILLAANYLDIKGLMQTCCKTVANQIKGKTPEELRAHFNIKNDFTPEEEEQIRKENACCAVEFAIAQWQEECGQLETLCKQLENNQSECLFVSHFEIKNHSSIVNNKKLVIKSDSKVVLNMWKLSLLAAFLLPSSIHIKESCISFSLDQDDFDKVIEFLHPLAQKMQCTKDHVNDYFSSLYPPTDDDLKQVITSVIEIQNDSHVFACWDTLKIGEFLAADSFWNQRVGGMREDHKAYIRFGWNPPIHHRKRTYRKPFKDSKCVIVIQYTSVTVSEDYENLLQALKPLSLRFRFGEVEEAEDFLFPLANLVEVIKIGDAASIYTQRVYQKKVCSQIVIDTPILSLEEGQNSAQLFNLLSKVCYLRMYTDAEEFEVNVGEYVIRSYTSQYEGKKMLLVMSVTLTSSDSKSFTVNRKAISHSGTIENLIMSMGLEDDEVPMPIPLPNVSGAVLQNVISWLDRHKDDAPYIEKDDKAEKRTDDVPQWDQDFLAKFETSDVLGILLAANYLDIEALLEYCIKTTSNMIKDKSRDELRKIFNIENDFTPEEEER
uniref:Skp1-related protein n=1 Tax=Pristionchus pacificus TaxID=54126 RepID=A0A8R1YMC4_PRIPA